MVDPELFQQTRRALYVCRVYDPAKHAKSGCEVRICVDCGRDVAVTTSVLADRMRSAREAGAKLEIVCDDCTKKEIGRTRAAIFVLPSRKEHDAANEGG